MEKILEILSGIKPGVDFASCDDLIGGHVLASFDIVRLVSELMDEFDIEITPPDIVPENFTSVEAIAALVERLEDE